MRAASLRWARLASAGWLGLLPVVGCVRAGFEPRDRGSACAVDRGACDAGGSVLADATPDAPVRDSGARADRSGGADAGAGDRGADAAGAAGTLTLVTSVASRLAGIGQSLARDGNTVAVGVSEGEDGIELLDLAEPASPRSTGLLRTDLAPAQISATDNDVLGLHLANGRAYLATYWGGLVVAEVSAGVPVHLGGLDLPGEAWAVQVARGRAYVANHTEGLAVVDIAVPTNPSLLYQLPLSGVTQDVQIVGTTLYVAARTHFHVLDLPPVGPPTVVGTLDMTIHDPTGTVYEVWSEGHYAYVVSKTGRRLLVIDVVHPNAPVVVWSSPAGSLDYRGLDGSGSRLYVGTGVRGAGSIQVYDLSQPSAPRLLDELSTGAAIYELAATRCGVVASAFDGRVRVASLQPCGP
ncbi:MAG: hypothetical protein IPG96_10040 [Proteobacteria bacterium]|nr:hypothetical protein [Pseudomonadota bacterium]